MINDFWLNDARRREAGNAFSTLRKKSLGYKLQPQELWEAADDLRRVAKERRRDPSSPLKEDELGSRQPVDGCFSIETPHQKSDAFIRS